MPTITTKDGTEIFYKDWGSGQPILFSHGWPLSADDWQPEPMAREFDPCESSGRRNDPPARGLRSAISNSM